MRRMPEPEPLPFFDEAHAGLQSFGLTAFRPGQAEVISAVMAGRNVVVVMPTGTGKSLCYQLPATLLPGTALVVSPLIALMKDQVEVLSAKSVPATFINSTLSESERVERTRRVREGKYKLVYVAPERFRSASFLDAIAEAQVSLLAIDEAHCISQWGHDFRPDYALLGQVRKRLRPPRTVALTATATPEVRDDIFRSLLMKDPQVFVAGFDRPNLFLEVVPVKSDDERRRTCVSLLTDGGSSIIYCSTRKAAETTHAALVRKRLPAVLYHAGMEDDARREAQDAFMADANGIAVATNAFGMGIDKADIRRVIHLNIPRAVEAYYQEIGRAGRDGQGAHALLLFNHADVFTQERLIQGNYPTESIFADIWKILETGDPFDHGVATLAGQIGASEFEVNAALRILEREGKIARGGRGEGSWGLTLQPKAKEVLPHSADAKALLAALLGAYEVGQSVTTDLRALGRRVALGEDDVRHALALLEKSGAVRTRKPFSGRAIRALSEAPFRELGLNLASLRDQERRARLLLKRMTDYAYGKRCRRAFILRYFGERMSRADCGSCDVCAGPRVLRTKDEPAEDTGPSELPSNYSALAFSELKRWRRELAQTLHIPPYIIFPDKTLIALATSLPVDRRGFMALKGTGDSRWERFGPKVVEICLLARAAGDTPVHASSVLKRKSS
jgi:ATP-dependent DNA helicase RecQ